MPCYEERRDSDCRESEKALQAARLKIDALTRVACDLAAVLRAGGTFVDLREVTRQWVEHHDEWDARRKAAGG